MATYSAISIAGGDTATPLSLAKRIRIISQVCNLSNARVLDCGCGAGEYVFHLRERYGTDAWGVEFLPEKVAAAQSNPRWGTCVRQGDLEHLDEPDATYDLALLNEVLEHVPNEHRALRQVYRVLKPGGMVVVFSPNRWFPFETHGVRLRGLGMNLSPAVPFVPYVPLAVGKLFLDYWARNYWPYELKALLRKSGFTIQRVTHIWQTFENISGSQPAIVRRFRPAFQAVANICERTPLVRRFGISQVIIARKSACL